MKKLKLLFLLSLSAFCATGCDLSQYISIKDNTSQGVDNNGSGEQNSNSGEGSGESGGGSEQGSGEGGGGSGEGSGEGGGKIEGGYYDGIDTSLSGKELLTQLRKLNNTKQKGTVGYSSMGTSPSGYFKYTDYDPNYVKYDSKGHPYGTKIISFYSGNTTASFNREHVWPNTHGGSAVEDDIHMTRPTISSENGSRGHSFYIENMKHNENGWDPAMESFGKENYRGDCARIIFYCMVAASNLVLTDDATRSSMTKNNEMGVISDMLSWNLRYPVLDREQRRNEGAEYLQGNRNPFIDHPEFACKIWGTTNDKTKQICGGK